jgi:hypothetical protein
MAKAAKKTPAKAASPKVKKEKKALKAMGKRSKPASPSRTTARATARKAAVPIKERIQRKKTTNPRLASGKVWLIEETLCVYKKPRTKKWYAQLAPRPNHPRSIDKQLGAITLNGAVIEAMTIYYDNGFDRKKPRVSRRIALQAVRDLISWTNDDPNREGLIGTPDRVVRAYEEFFSGYTDNPDEILKTQFAESGGYDEMVALVDIPFESHCEHHMVPFCLTSAPMEQTSGIA